MEHGGRPVWDVGLSDMYRDGPLGLWVRHNSRRLPAGPERRGVTVLGMPSVPGAASLAVRDLLTGAQRSGRVVAVFPSCAYVELAGQLVAVEAAAGLRLPCAVVLAAGRRGVPFRDVASGDAAEAFDGLLRLGGGLVVRVTRWWAAARPRGTVAAAGVTADARWDALVLGLLGLGPGLTPAGDDLLAGLLVGLATRPDLRDPLAAAVSRHAAQRTTWLSAELLRHASAGLAMPAVVAVADALAGHGDDAALTRSVPRLLAVGHTSGTALARGLLLAAQTASRHPLGLREAA